MNVGIIGSGHIADKMAKVLNGIKGEVTPYAIASRNIDKAIEFKNKWGFLKAYGSYLELAMDPNIDLVYIATPHSFHYENTRLCLENGKNCLVEKAFCANKKQAKELIDLAKNKRLLLAEAMWTRYMPSRWQIKNILDSGIIGKINTIESDYSIPISSVPRLNDPNLCGGALLDLGIYSLTIPIMYFGAEIKNASLRVDKLSSGVDATTYVNLYYNNGIIAKTKCSCVDSYSNYAKVIGDKGYLVFGPINAPEYIDIYDNNGNKIDSISIKYRVNGYEYQVLECKRMIEAGKLETESMPLSETLRMMGYMDSIRYQAGIIYPFEEKEDLSKEDLSFINA